MMEELREIDFAALRNGLAELPRASNHKPGDPVEPEHMLILPLHRAVLDFDRELVVGNRGMGKSFWAHALVSPLAREKAAAEFSQQSRNGLVLMGFNASERNDGIAPTPTMIRDALAATGDPDLIWRAVLARIAARYATNIGITPPTGFTELCEWARSHGEQVDTLITQYDDELARTERRLLVVFDALDRLGQDWKATRSLTSALLKRALAVKSYRKIRFKLFMRQDQFEDNTIFQFTDGSKVRNTRVDLKWLAHDLYRLLFAQLAQHPSSNQAFERLRFVVLGSNAASTPNEQEKLINPIAGEFMGATKKRGRVYSWLPLHLSDARGETSPRTFLTAWRQAALHEPAPAHRAVDHLGLIEGVRKASEDRLAELREDYWWITDALSPLRGEMVPMENALLMQRWREHNTVESIRTKSASEKRLPPVQIENESDDAEPALLKALIAIGIVELRHNSNKINVPDIFRVEAGIKRKGGVKPPLRHTGA